MVSAFFTQCFHVVALSMHEGCCTVLFRCSAAVPFLVYSSVLSVIAAGCGSDSNDNLEPKHLLDRSMIHAKEANCRLVYNTYYLCTALVGRHGKDCLCAVSRKLPFHFRFFNMSTICVTMANHNKQAEHLHCLVCCKQPISLHIGTVTRCACGEWNVGLGTVL